MMRAKRVTMGRREFYLAQDASIAELNVAIGNAVQVGGGMVPLPVSGNRSVTILVTSHITVFVEEFDIPDGDEADTTDHVIFTDFEYNEY